MSAGGDFFAYILLGEGLYRIKKEKNLESFYRKHKEITRLYEPKLSDKPDRPLNNREKEYLKNTMIPECQKLYASIMRKHRAFDATDTAGDFQTEGYLFMIRMLEAFSKPTTPTHIGKKKKGVKSKPLEYYFKYYFAGRCRILAVNAVEKSRKNSVDEFGEEIESDDLFSHHRDDDTPKFKNMTQKEMEIAISDLRGRLSGNLAKERTLSGNNVKSKAECLWEDIRQGIPERVLTEKYSHKNNGIWHPKDRHRNKGYQTLRALVDLEEAKFRKKYGDEKGEKSES